MWRDASPILVGFVKSDKPSSNQINTTSRRLLERVNRKPFVNRSLWHKRIRCLRPDFHYYNFSLPLTPWEIQEYEIVLLNNCFVTLESSKICSEFLFRWNRLKFVHNFCFFFFANGLIYSSRLERYLDV